MRKDPWLKALIVLLVIIAASYLAGLAWTLVVRFADIVLLLALAWALAFALEPLTAQLEARSRMPRGLAVAIAYLGLLILLSLLTVMVVPVVALQVTQIGTNLPQYAAEAGNWLRQAHEWLLERGVSANLDTLLDYREIARRVESLSPMIVNQALGLATGVASVLFSLVLVLVFSFYIALDGSKLTEGFLKAVPSNRRSEVEYLIYSVHRTFGGFIRGQLLQAVVYGLGTAAVMLATGLSYVAVAAIFAFAIMMIPFIGPILAIIPPVAISLFTRPEQTWLVFLLLLALQQVVLNVIAPKVMSMSVGMHPLLVLVALLVGAKLAGVWGAIFAVPVAGVVVAMVAFYRMTVEERRVYLEGRAAEAHRPTEAPSPAYGSQAHDGGLLDC